MRRLTTHERINLRSWYAFHGVLSMETRIALPMKDALDRAYRLTGRPLTFVVGSPYFKEPEDVRAPV